MITAKLTGGLGGQMFQIAAATALALENNDECAFDLRADPVNQGNGAWNYSNSIFKKIKSLPLNWRPLFIYKETEPNYKKIAYKRGLMIEGYFASEKYFKNYQNQIIRLFKEETLLDKIKNSNKDYFKNSVSMHIRRGDYLRFPEVYTKLNTNYYLKALSLLEMSKKIDTICVLSDDIDWCKKNLKDKRIVFIESLPDYIDLYIMALCENNIMANSGFSWWGTYLNENKDKLVYSPEKWFERSGPKDFTDIFCDNWIRL